MRREEMVRALRSMLLAELSAVELYTAHAEAIEEEEIARGVRAILEAEKEHAQKFMQCIRAMGGKLPREAARAAAVGRSAGAAGSGNVVEMLEKELAEEQQAIREYCRLVEKMEFDDDILLMFALQLVDEVGHAMWLKKNISKLREES